MRRPGLLAVVCAVSALCAGSFVAGCGHHDTPAAPAPAKPSPYLGIPLDRDNTRVADAVTQLSGIDPCGFIDPNMARQYGKLRQFGPSANLHDCEADVYNPGDSAPGRVVVELQNNSLAPQNTAATVGAAKVYVVPTTDPAACGYLVPLTEATDPMTADFRFAYVHADHFPTTRTLPCEIAGKVATVAATAVHNRTLPHRTGAERAAYPLAEHNACELFGKLPPKYTVVGSTPGAKPGVVDPARPAIAVGSCTATVNGPQPTTTVPAVPPAPAAPSTAGQVSVTMILAAQNSALPKPVAPARVVTVAGHTVLVTPTPGAATSTVAFLAGDVIDNNLPQIPAGNTFTNPDYLGPGRSYPEVTLTLPTTMLDDLTPAALQTFTP